MPRITRTATRDLHNRSRVVAYLELRLAREGERFDEQGLSPGFSATCDIWEARSNASGKARQRMGREADSGGAASAAIVRAFPKLKPFVDLHLSDPDGVPMHAEANGWYFYAGSRPDVTTERYTGYTGDIYSHHLERFNLPDTDQGRRDYCYRVACHHLRVDEIVLDVERKQVGVQVTPDGKVPLLEAADEFTSRLHQAFTEFVDAQRERWAQEAQAARELLESLPEED